MADSIDVTKEYEAARKHPIVNQIIERLWNELPKDLYYHSAGHSEDVLREVLILANTDGRSEREKHLLAVAAAYHDSGFLRSPLDNERFGARLAEEAMTFTGGYSPDEIELVTQMILDTRLQSTPEGLHQAPSKELSGYLLDADMSNLGRDDFVDKLELLRREFGFERVLFLRRTYDLIRKHKWHTKAAISMRSAKTAENVEVARALLEREESVSGTGVLLGTERLSFLARLPLLLNSSLSVKEVIERSIDHLRMRLSAEAATVFLLDRQAQQLTFWALRGGESSKLSGQRMPAGRGVVGWVIANNQSALVNDAAKDKRFFSVIDNEAAFKTRNMICVPLSVRGEAPFGAIQALNREKGGDFAEEDLQFFEQFAALISLSLDNALLLEKLRERTHALEVLEKRKNDVITVVAHEFRTPLNVIQNSADLLSTDSTDTAEERLKIGAALTRGVERLGKLVSQIRSVSFVGSESVALEKEKVDLDDFLQRTIDEFPEVFKERNLNFTYNGTKGIHAEIDEALIRIVVRNIISNAIRFTPDKGSISLTLSSKAGMAIIEVKDSGIGIEKDKIPLIAEKFFEVVDAMYHTSGDFQFGSSGLGLGLSAVKSILKAHESSLEVESELGKGSTFRFRLKL